MAGDAWHRQPERGAEAGQKGRVDQQLTVESENGTNVITVKDGKVAVTEADCPDGYCMERGFCSGGAQIVCLPNRLVLHFIGQSDVDFVVG